VVESIHNGSASMNTGRPKNTIPTDALTRDFQNKEGLAL
jgi:hypothetical protein